MGFRVNMTSWVLGFVVFLLVRDFIDIGLYWYGTYRFASLF